MASIISSSGPNSGSVSSSNKAEEPKIQVVANPAPQAALVDQQKAHIPILDINAQDENGNTALHRAAAGEGVLTVDALLAAGADPDISNKLGETPLHIAVRNNNRPAVESLLEDGAEIDARRVGGVTPLHLAIAVDPELVELLIKEGANKEAQTSGEAVWTPLRAAVEVGNLETVEILIGAGVDVDDEDENGQTSFHRAAANGNIALVETLRGAGADMHASDHSGVTVFHCAVESGNVYLARTFINADVNVNAQDENGETALGRALITRNLEMFNELISGGANVNISGANGVTLLHRAVEGNDLEFFNSLINAGANINAVDNEGNSVLHRAAMHGRLKMAQKLIDLGADKDAQNKFGETPLHFAAQGNKKEIVLVLLAAGAKQLQENNGEVPLHGAATGGFTDIIQIFLQAGAQPEARNNTGHTPLHVAADHGHIEAIQVLLKAGANINVQDDHGYTPIHWAYDRRNISIYQMLLKNGAKWEQDTGGEYNERDLLAAAWGKGDNTIINGKTTIGEWPAMRTPPPQVFSQILKSTNSATEIAEAFEADKELDITKRLDKIKNGELVIIKNGYKEHAISLVFYKGYLAICNRGEWGATQVFKINSSQVTDLLLTEINAMASEKESSKAENFFYTRLPAALKDPKGDDAVCQAFNKEPLQKFQKAGFCAYNSPEAALFTILALQKILDPKRTSDISTAIKEAKETYKRYTTLFRLSILQRYLHQIETGKIKKEGIDKELLEEIHSRLIDPEWHPERFQYKLTKFMRDELLVKLKKVLSQE